MNSWYKTLWVSLFLLSAICVQAETVLVPLHADKKVFVPHENIVYSWRYKIDYDDSEWMTCSGTPGGIGYERGNGYEKWISLDVEDEMHQSAGNPSTSCFIRIVFDLDQTAIDTIGYLKLNVLYDDGFAAFLNRRKIAAANEPDHLRWDAAATGNHEANGMETFDIANPQDLLNPGKNLLTVQALNVSTSSSDFLFNVELVGQKTLFGEFNSSNLPLVFIDTGGQSIPGDKTPIIADMGIIDNGPNQPNKLTDPFNDFYGRIRINVRGSSSLSFPKKQFRMETQDVLGNDLNVSLMGLPEEDDWILHAPYSDKTLMRNALIYKLSNDIGRYATRTKFCELILNGQYWGVYILMEKIKRDKNRVDIAKLNPDEVSGDDVTGGYIIKIDKEPHKPGFESRYPPPRNRQREIKYQYDYPDANDIVPEQEQYIKGFIDDFEDLMFSDEYDDPETGFHRVVDVGSFVDFFLLNELSKNVDGYRLSTFLHKDKDSNDGRLKMGPIWDFNLGFGNADYYAGWLTHGWQVEFMLSDEMNGGDTWQVPFYWERLMETPRFTKEIFKRWNALRTSALSTPRIFGIIDSLYTHIGEARIRNYKRWPVIGVRVWPNYFIGETYDQEIDWMKQWIKDRADWMDDRIANYATTVAESESSITPKTFVLHQNSPNPFNGSTRIDYELPGPAHVTMTIFNARGQQVRKITFRNQNAGQHNVMWDGLNDEFKAVPSGVYFYQLFVRGSTVQDFQKRKMVLLR